MKKITFLALLALLLTGFLSSSEAQEEVLGTEAIRAAVSSRMVGTWAMSETIILPSGNVYSSAGTAQVVGQKGSLFYGTFTVTSFTPSFPFSGLPVPFTGYISGNAVHVTILAEAPIEVQMVQESPVPIANETFEIFDGTLSGKTITAVLHGLGLSAFVGVTGYLTLTKE